MSEAGLFELTVKGGAEIAKMQPGDVLLVKVDALLTFDTHRNVEKAISGRLPEGVKTLIVGKDFDFSILRPAPEAPPTPKTRHKPAEAWPSFLTDRPISHVEAREIADRLVHSMFRLDDVQHERARASIPANPDRDDDLLINAYIRQQAARDRPALPPLRDEDEGSD